MGRLDGKITIVTGATSGIGRRTVEIFVKDGARVVATGRREELGRSLEASLGKDKCLFVKADATKEAEVKAMVDTCVSKWGRLDSLFNNAGGPSPVGGIEGISVEGFDAAMATLVRSVMLGMKHAAPIMMKQGSGSIINNGSVAARRAFLRAWIKRIEVRERTLTIEYTFPVSPFGGGGEFTEKVDQAEVGKAPRKNGAGGKGGPVNAANGGSTPANTRPAGGVLSLGEDGSRPQT